LGATTLGELRRAKPQDTTLAADWKDLLESVGLEDIATEAMLPKGAAQGAIAPSCTANKEIDGLSI
jgi:hypothetical protein